MLLQRNVDDAACHERWPGVATRLSGRHDWLSIV